MSLMSFVKVIHNNVSVVFYFFSINFLHFFKFMFSLLFYEHTFILFLDFNDYVLSVSLFYEISTGTHSFFLILDHVSTSLLKSIFVPIN